MPNIDFYGAITNATVDVDHMMLRTAQFLAVLLVSFVCSSEQHLPELSDQVSVADWQVLWLPAVLHASAAAVDSVVELFVGLFKQWCNRPSHSPG